jgi:hypothetical protein
MKRKIIGFLGIALFTVSIGLKVQVTNSNDAQIENMEALAYYRMEHCTQTNDTYCEYSDHTPSSGNHLMIPIPETLY